jgi:hypothetical protein
MRCAQGTIFVSSADELIYSFNADDGDNVTIIGRDKAKSCVLRGFLDFVTNALVGFAACPFGLGRHWLADIWEAAEVDVQFRGATVSD